VRLSRIFLIRIVREAAAPPARWFLALGLLLLLRQRGRGLDARYAPTAARAEKVGHAAGRTAPA
jgi:hypothetical protein